MKKLTILMPEEISERFQKIVEYSTKGYDCSIINSCEEMNDLRNKRILFAVYVGDSGINIELFKMFKKIRLEGFNSMKNSVGSVLISSNDTDLFTRDIARDIIFHANLAGCTFPGRPLAEATGSLKNLNNQHKLDPGKTLEEICLEECRKIVVRLMDFEISKPSNPKILTLHSSNYKTSNTLALWKKVKNNLNDCTIKEINIENGSVVDCKGCPYKMCKHYSQSDTCFYGGVMVTDVYPALMDCDILMMLCPNYNDSISANLSAVINRLTALFRKVKFYDKYVYSIIVSGFSGSDIVAKQLISSLNINKTFVLPSKFALMETANDRGDVEKIEEINEKAKGFAENIKKWGISPILDRDDKI